MSKINEIPSTSMFTGFLFFLLPGCMTTGNTIEEAVKNAQDAKREWLLCALKDGLMIEEPSSLEDYSGQFKLRIPKSLHETGGLCSSFD